MPSLNNVSILVDISVEVERVHLNLSLSLAMSCVLPVYQVLSRNTHGLFGLELAHSVVVRLERVKDHTFQVKSVLGNR